MAENKPEIKPAPKSAFSLIDPRDHFIGIALGKLLDQAIAKGTIGQYDVTAAHAVRYADAVMAVKAEPPKKLSSGQGKVEKQLPPPQPPAPIEPPKTVAEQLTGPAELLAEVA